jgi:sterol desaturase/sphingolipid hydroxylase (fatty acid hydroxylase superfamily)
MRLDTNGYYAVGVPAYLLVVAIELAALRRRGIESYSFEESIANMSAGLGEVTIGVFIGPFLIALYDWAYAHLALFHVPAKGPWAIASWVYALFLADFCYYLYHRASHAVGAFWAIHGVHHQAEELNVTVALRHPWLSDSYSAPFYALCPILGVPTAQFFVAISVVSFYAFTVHSRTFKRPGFFLFVTPQTHIVHHAYNPRYIDKNFGAMFTLWDRMFGTHVEVIAEDPPRLGTLSGCDTYDGARAQWIGFERILQKARRAKTLAQALGAFVRPPAWLPPGMTPSPRVSPPRAHTARGLRAANGARGGAAQPIHFRIGVAAAFATVLLVGAHLFLSSASLSAGARIAEGALVLASLHVLGRAVDAGARGARGSIAWLALATFVCACGPVGSYLAPAKKPPREHARDVDDKCGGIMEDDVAPLMRRRGLESVETSTTSSLGPNGRVETPRGARIHVRPSAGLTRERIARGLECHEARVIIGRWTAQENEPWVLPQKWVDFEVAAEGDGFVVDVITDDPEDAKTVLARAQAFMAHH